jgi:uncharacterized protein YcfJ
MIETLTPQEPAPPVEAEVPVESLHEAPIEDGLVAGRPVEDRSFEVVEVGAGAVAGMVIGTAVAPGLGTAIGGVVGGAVALVAGEALERHEGRAAQTIDAVDEEPVPHG